MFIPQYPSAKGHWHCFFQQLRALHFFVGPLKPRHQGFQIRFLHGGSTPDADRWWGIPISSDVVGYILLLQKGNEGLDLIGGQVKGQTNGGRRASRGVFCQEINPLIFSDERLNDAKVIFTQLDKSRDTFWRGVRTPKKVRILYSGNATAIKANRTYLPIHQPMSRRRCNLPRKAWRGY